MDANQNNTTTHHCIPEVFYGEKFFRSTSSPAHYVTATVEGYNPEIGTFTVGFLTEIAGNSFTQTVDLEWTSHSTTIIAILHVQGMRIPAAALYRQAEFDYSTQPAGVMFGGLQTFVEFMQ